MSNAKHFKLEQNILTDPQHALKYEWLETNGIGGFATSTSIGCSTRKYHGLLNLPLFGNRMFNLLAKVEETILSGKNTFHLSTNKYKDVFSPTGHKYAAAFTNDLHPIIEYRIGDIVFKKSILMPFGENTILIKYELVDAEKPIVFQINPLLSYREIHALSHENMFFRVKTFQEEKQWKIDPYEGMPPLYFSSNSKFDFYAGPDWYKNFEYMKERNRGYDFSEDLFSPGFFEIKLKPGKSVVFKISIDEEYSNAEKQFEAETTRREEEFSKIDKLHPGLKEKQPSVDFLLKKASYYLIDSKRGNTPSVIAGYPWFGEWGRDTMISLAGLTLFNGKEKEMFEILSTYTKYEKNGLLPNQLGLGQESSYNSIDASLWFFRAIGQYLLETKDTKQVKKVLGSAMKNIITAHFDNKVPHASFDSSSGLLSVGSPYTQLTWMDANAYGKPVTPRYGKAIEINALWFNALSLYEELFPKEISQIAPTIELIKTSFLTNYLVEDNNGVMLVDTIHENGEKIAEFRPNQLFACALPYELIPAEIRIKIIKRVETELLTAMGLRTLSPSSPNYKGDYSGNQDMRDSAYHQGTVWPWLLGAYVDTVISSCSKSSTHFKNAVNVIDTILNDHVSQYGIGGISEIAEGNSPHRAKGCPFQAWSVSEVIRAYMKLNSAKK